MQNQDDITQNPDTYDTGDPGSEFSLILRGRYFSSSDLEIISRCVQEHFEQGRVCIYLTICEKLDWKQPNGHPKDRACYDLLRQLEIKGFIKLPPLPTATKQKKVRGQTAPKSYLFQYDIISPVTEFPKTIDLEFVKDNNSKFIWKSLVENYHYLGSTCIVGRSIKYLVKADNHLLGALAFSSPAWRLAARDSVLNLLGIDAAKINDYVINNSRLLLLPNVKVGNLASKILSLATNKVVKDWTEYYSLTPLLAETFVQPSLYKGTCYKAANWIEIGLTKGYAKKGSAHHNGQEPKQIFLYGLNRHIRRKLLKAVQESK
jgi:hypothetical protein